MTEPLTHARIGYDSITKRGTITASAELTGFPASAAANELTYSFWSAGLPSTWEVRLAQAEACNYFGIAAHTLYINNAMAVLQAWIDFAWKTIPVLTTVGDLWHFDGDFFGERGGAPGTTVGSLRRGLAVDGYPVHLSGVPLSKFGTHGLTVEPAVTNLFPVNVRTGGDDQGDLTDFDAVSSDASYSTDQAVSGAGSILVSNSGAAADLWTDSISGSSSQAYTAQAKVLVTEQITTVSIAIWGNVSGIIGSGQYSNVQPGAWNFISTTQTTGGSDTQIAVLINITGGSCYVDEMQIETGTLAHSWVDGSRAAGGLAFQEEILQQFAGACTVSFWIRAPSAGTTMVLLVARDGPQDNVFQISKEAGATANIIFTTRLDGGSSDDLYSGNIAWDDTWRMITVVLDAGASGVNKLIYVNGSLAASKLSTQEPDWQAMTIFQVGHKGGTGEMGDDGATVMDDLMILNRAASLAEIRAWYDSGETMGLATAGLPSHSDDRPIMVLTQETTAQRFRIRIAGQTTPLVGVIYIGKALEMMRPLYGGHTPINLSHSTIIRPNTSDRGQFVGRSIIRTGVGTPWDWRNLEADWVRRYLDPFIESARTLPFFLLWRPATFPEGSAYCWTPGDQKPQNMGTADLMSFTLEAIGIGYD
jgi:hypothetical protein